LAIRPLDARSEPAEQLHRKDDEKANDAGRRNRTCEECLFDGVGGNSDIGNLC